MSATTDDTALRHGIRLDRVGTAAQIGSQVERISWIVGIAAIGLAFLFNTFADDAFRQFQHSYLFNLVFWLSISVGGLFFTTIQFLARAGWSVVVRRFAEICGIVVLPLAVCFLPVIGFVLAGNAEMYEWLHPHAGEAALAEAKKPFLTPGFFALGSVIVFLVWFFFAWKFFRLSVKQDESNEPEKLTYSQERWAAGGIFAIALGTSLAICLWVMTLEWTWYSTIIGVYYFAASMVAFLATAILFLNWLQRRGMLQEEVTIEHYHDLGKLMYALNCFWAYIAFSQFMLIWYANIPEETQWFQARSENGWFAISMALAFGHFIIPFFGMMSRFVKRDPKKLQFWACWILFFGYLDMFWLVMPELAKHGTPTESPAYGLTDLLCFVGLGAIFFAGFIRLGGRRPLVPVRDPRLPESLDFHNT